MAKTKSMVWQGALVAGAVVLAVFTQQVVLAHLGREITAVAMLLSTAHHTPAAVEVAQAQSEQMAVVQIVVLAGQERHLLLRGLQLHVLVVAVAATIMAEIVALAGQAVAATAKTIAIPGVLVQQIQVAVAVAAQTAKMAVQES